MFLIRDLAYCTCVHKIITNYNCQAQGKKNDQQTGNIITSAWKWMNLLRNVRMQNKDDNKHIKDYKKDCSGIATARVCK